MSESKTKKFVHLNVHSDYSIKESVGKIKDYVARAKELGMKYLALTDSGDMHGITYFCKECHKQGITPIIGCEVYLAPENNSLILLAENQIGYRNLVKIISESQRYLNAKPFIYKFDFEKYHEGIICLSGFNNSDVSQAILENDNDTAIDLIKEYIDIFGKDNFFLEIQNHGLDKERQLIKQLAKLSEILDIGLAATNDCRYVNKDDSYFHSLLQDLPWEYGKRDNSIAPLTTKEHYLKSPEEMAELFAEYQDAIDNTIKIAQRCKVNLGFEKLRLPQYSLPADYNDHDSYLRFLCEQALPSKYSEITPAILQRLESELEAIKNIDYSRYFLITLDIINKLRQEHICNGFAEGPLTNSIVAYLLGITALDPIALHLPFEDFINITKYQIPNVKISIKYWHLESAIDCIKDLYGSNCVAAICATGTMTAKGAIQDLSMALDIPLDEMRTVAKLVPFDLEIPLDEFLRKSDKLSKIYKSSDKIKHLIDMAIKLEGMPRLNSADNKTIIISDKNINNYFPIVNINKDVFAEIDEEQLQDWRFLKLEFITRR